MATALATPPGLHLVDLRDLRGVDILPLLDGQARRWRERLHWDFTSTQTVIQRFLDGRNLYGYALASARGLEGYCYFIQDGHKALLGDLYLENPGGNPGGEDLLLRRTLEAAALYPGVRRVEGQLLDLGAEVRGRLLFSRPIEVFNRRYMVREGLEDFHAPPARYGSGRLRSWRDSDLEGASKLIAESYVGHVDSRINDQYRNPLGASRFVFNTIQHTGCGNFLAAASMLAHRRFRSTPLGLCLCTRVAADAGHIAQLCVDPAARRQGVGYAVLRESLQALGRLGCHAASLTVTDSNTGAIRLYEQLGFTTWRRFPAFVWEAE
jgi:ribosomal protein S18 acetylase RimI-like enzyme